MRREDPTAAGAGGLAAPARETAATTQRTRSRHATQTTRATKTKAKRPRGRPRTGAETTCAQCGATFWAQASEGGRRYCSRACWRTAIGVVLKPPARRRRRGRAGVWTLDAVIDQIEAQRATARVGEFTLLGIELEILRSIARERAHGGAHAG